MGIAGEGVVDLSQIVGFGLGYAQWIGGALLAAGIGIRIFGRAISRTLFAVGILATAAFAYQEWQAVHSLMVAGGILLIGLILFGLLAWTVRGLSFLFAFVLIAAAFYLLAYGWMGPSFVGTTQGALAWAGATIATMALTGVRGHLVRGVPAAALGAGLAH